MREKGGEHRVEYGGVVERLGETYPSCGSWHGRSRRESRKEVWREAGE